MVLKGLIFYHFHLKGCGGLKRTYFQHFFLWNDAVVLKGVIFNSCFLGGCGDLERTDFC